MGVVTLNDADGTLAALISARALETGVAPEDVAREAILRSLMWTPEQRLAHIDGVRATARSPANGQPVEDSVTLIRRRREGE